MKGRIHYRSTPIKPRGMFKEIGVGAFALSDGRLGFLVFCEAPHGPSARWGYELKFFWITGKEKIDDEKT